MDQNGQVKGKEIMLRKMNLLCLSFLLFVPMVSVATTVMSHSVIPYTDGEEKPFGISFNTTLNTTTDKPDSYHHDVSANFAIDATYKFKNKITLAASIGFDKNLDGLRENSFANSYLGLSRQIMKSKGVLSLTASSGFIFPTNQDKRELDSFRGAIKGGTNLSYKFDKIGIKGLTLSWKFDAKKNFYKYTSSRSGSIQSQASLGNKLKASYKLGKFTFAFTFGNTHSWSYSNNRLTDKFSMGQKIAYEPIHSLMIAIGHTNMANAFQANGEDSNIEIYDPLNSTVYVSAGLTY